MASRIDWEKTRHNTDRAFDILAICVGIVIGIAMIAQGAYRVYQNVDGGMDVLFNLAQAVMIVGGVSVIGLSFVDRIKMTGAYAMGLGLSRTLLRVYDLSDMSDIGGIILEMAFLLLALNLMRIGFYFVRGLVVSRGTLILTASIMLATDILIIVVDQYAGEYLDFLSIDIDSYYFMLNALMYLALIGLLDTKLIRDNTELALQAKVLDRFRAAYTLEEKSNITREAAGCLLERSGPLWRDVNDGTVRSEMAFTITNKDSRSDAVAQIWEGRDPIYFTVIHEGDSAFNANRFRIDKITESDGILYGYGRDGARFRIVIKEEDAQ